MGVALGANAQVVVDSSFGSGGALNGPNFQIPDNLGKTVGDNLFHSFEPRKVQAKQGGAGNQHVARLISITDLLVTNV